MTPRRRVCAVDGARLIAAVVVAAAILSSAMESRRWLLDRADGAAVIVIVEDGAGGERRADSILVAQWWRSCDRLSVASIPRDLVLAPDGVQLTVLHDRVGSPGLADMIDDALHLDVVASITMSLDDVEAISEDLGPITVELDTASRDLRSGFHGGPGLVELSGEHAVAFLRSRHWEELSEAGWEVVDVTDGGRIGRLHEYLAAAAVATNGHGADGLAGALNGVARNSQIDIDDRTAAAAFVVGAGSARSVELGVIPTRPERSVAERRSPFEPDHLGATYRAVLDESFSGLPAGCGDGFP